MTTKGNRDYRPVCHYTPPHGWTNDPNGLVYEDGVWHLFAQHYPDDTHWGPMHWRHAVSDDLLHWRDLGIALYPDEALGMIFSGSAVIDVGNTSGLGVERDPMILMFTHHGEHEQQSIAFSEDRVHFTKYAGNPVIANTDKRDFRDPKVFRNPFLNCWSAVVAAGDRFEFYASDDLIHWRKTGEFGASENRLSGVCECPDLFPLNAPNGEEMWVLIASNGMAAPFGGFRMQYYLGQFDGETYRETCPSDQPKILDSGYDDYAAVTFYNADRRLLVGWAESLVYGADGPTNDFCGTMTYARELSLVDTDLGLRLAMKPVTPDFDLISAPAISPQQFYPHGSIPRAEGMLTCELFHIRVEAESAFTLTLSNDEGEALNVSVSNEQRLVVDRSNAGLKDFNALFASGLFSVMSAPRTQYGPVTLDLYFDHMIAEIYADGGTVVNTSVVFPGKPYQKATLLGKGKMWIGQQPHSLPHDGKPA